MPQIVGALIVTQLIGEAAAGFTIGATGITLSSVVGTAVLTAASIGLSLALSSNPSIPKPADGHLAIRQSIPSRVHLDGRARLAGKYMLYSQASNISYDVLALCQGPVARFVTLFLHDDIVTFEIDPVSGLQVVTGCPANQDGRYTGDVIKFAVRHGLATETAFAAITTVPAFATIWTSAHRGDGIAGMMLICTPTASDFFQKIYPQGLPSPSWEMDGPAIWDFRDPAQDPDDATTWTDYPDWSAITTYAALARVNYMGSIYISPGAANLNNIPDADKVHWIPVAANPVLGIVNYLLDPDHGMGMDRATMIDTAKASLVIEANHCDEMVLRKDGNLEPRYTANGFYNYDTDPAEVLTAKLAACDGWMTEDADGTLALVVGVYRDQSAILTDRHIVGMSQDHGQADEQITNELTISFTSPQHGYRQIDAQPWRDEADISARGVTRTQNLPLTWVQSHAQARRLAKRAMARIQAPTRGTGIATLYGLTILGKRWVRLQYSLISGLSDCWVEIQRVETDFQAGRVTFDWIAIDPTTIDLWNPSTEEGMEPPVVDDPDATIQPVPIDVTAALVGDPTTGTHFEIKFDDPDIPGLGWVVRYRLALDPSTGLPGPWIEQTTVSDASDGTTVTLSTSNVQANQDYIVEVASVGVLGGRSDWSDSVTVSSDGGAIVDDEHSATLLDEAGFSILADP